MRYAIYWAPAADSPLDRFGTNWLGRAADSARAVPQPHLPGVDPAVQAEMTAEARRYGFHATLKPPFALAPGRAEKQLIAAIARLAAATPRPAPLWLYPARLAGFLALTPEELPDDLAALADACVRDLDGFRKPADAAELTRRRAAKLTAAQDRYLIDWGYPYVFDEFRFHLTLTRRLDETETGLIVPALERLVVPLLKEPVTIDALSLFVEPEPGAPFTLRQRFALAPPASE